MRRSVRNGSYGDAMSFRGCHCHHDAVRFYRNAVNAVAVIMQILMADPQGCAIASPWALLYRPVRAGFQLTEASRNKQCFQFRLSLFSIFLRVLSPTVDETKNGIGTTEQKPQSNAGFLIMKSLFTRLLQRIPLRGDCRIYEPVHPVCRWQSPCPDP